MKKMKTSIYIFAIACILFASCKKDLTVEVNGGAPEFEVTLDAANTYKAGQPVLFNFEGSPQIISFFSGELYRQYEFREGRTIGISNPSMVFTSAVTGGAQANQLRILASTDFNGVYNDTLKAPLTDILAATWTDITSRFTLGSTATFASSGTKNIADLVVDGKPLYIAFKYNTQPQTANGAARTWMVQTFGLTAASANGNVSLTDQVGAGFRVIDGNPDTAPTRSSVSATRVTLLGNTFTPDNDPATEVWAISRAFDMGSINYGPDRPVGLKGLANPKMKSYAYTFANEGTYKVYFIAKNANAYEEFEVVKSVDVTIVP
jgi:hypothetical protein